MTKALFASGGVTRIGSLRSIRLILSLTPFDQLTIRQLANWTEITTVTLGGEIRAPGEYTITEEGTLSSLIQRAGGLT